MALLGPYYYGKHKSDNYLWTFRRRWNPGTQPTGRIFDFSPGRSMWLANRSKNCASRAA